jgi:hypothetical protein
MTFRVALVGDERQFGSAETDISRRVQQRFQVRFRCKDISEERFCELWYNPKGVVH